MIITPEVSRTIGGAVNTICLVIMQIEILLIWRKIK